MLTPQTSGPSGFKIKLKLSASNPGSNKLNEVIEPIQAQPSSSAVPRSQKVTLRFGGDKGASTKVESQSQPEIPPIAYQSSNQLPLYALPDSSHLFQQHFSESNKLELSQQQPRNMMVQPPLPTSSNDSSNYIIPNPYAVVPQESIPVVRLAMPTQPIYVPPPPVYQPSPPATRHSSPPHQGQASPIEQDYDYSRASPAFSNASLDDGDLPFQSRSGSVISGSVNNTKRKRSPVESKSKKSKALVSGQFSIPRIARLENGAPVLPIPVGVLILRNIGTVVKGELFHTPRYIYPLDYECARPYPSMIDPSATVEYVSRVTMKKGSRASEAIPHFTVEPADQPGVFISGASPTAAWSQILKSVNELRQRKTSNSISGPDYFGFSQNVVKALIQELPGVTDLPNYVWQEYLEEAYEPPEVYKPVKKYKKREKESKREESQDPYFGSPFLDQFGTPSGGMEDFNSQIDPFAIPEPEFDPNFDPYALPIDENEGNLDVVESFQY